MAPPTLQHATLLLGGSAVPAIKDRLESISSRHTFFAPASSNEDVNQNPFLIWMAGAKKPQEIMERCNTVVVCVHDMTELRMCFPLTELFRSYQMSIFLCFLQTRGSELLVRQPLSCIVECQTLHWFRNRIFSVMEGENPSELLRALVRAAKSNPTIPLQTISHPEHMQLSQKRAMAKEKFLMDQIADAKQIEVLRTRFATQLGLTLIA